VNSDEKILNMVTNVWLSNLTGELNVITYLYLALNCLFKLYIIISMLSLTFVNSLSFSVGIESYFY